MSSGFAAGLILIVLGVGLFLANVGLLPFAFSVGSVIPLCLIFWGALALIQSRSVSSAVFPVTAIVAGSLVIFLHLSIWSTWPLVLVASGVLAMVSGASLRNFTSKFIPGSTQSRLQEVAVFSGIKRRVETPSFEGGELSCVFGGIEIDLRRSRIIGETVLEANALFGGIEVRVPEDWRVVVQGFAAFGAYEDKTLPPRPEPGIVPPVLTIRGNTAFGGVSVRN